MTAPQPGTAPLNMDVAPRDWAATLASVVGDELLPKGGTMVITLAPEALGPLRVTVELVGNEASVTVQATTPDAARMIASPRPTLLRRLARWGCR